MIFRVWTWIGIALLAGLAVSPASDPNGGKITTLEDEVGKLLNAWSAEGKAAGLQAITYENRDGGHSQLPRHQWPDLKHHEFSAAETAAGRTKGPAQEGRPHPTLGNCSMAAPADRGGSLARFYFMEPQGNTFLFKQYFSNQLFIYPEHRDHDIGANGIGNAEGGWGDLFPANSPALLISQGSSGSDQPFLRAVLATLAAFPPETQKLLIEKRVLIPTVQAILRQSLRTVKSDEDYFTAAAHPVVFNAADLDVEKMVRTANQMTPDGVPPIATIEVKDETEFEPNRHYFEREDILSHQLGTSPVSISRVFRGNVSEYQMLLDMSKSGDLMGQPLRTRWAVLQGDPKSIRIEVVPGRAVARLSVRWQPPTATSPPQRQIRSHRVDIALFAESADKVSAPAIVSFYMLPNERRYYDDQGRLTEICYQTHNPDLGLPVEDDDERWAEVFKACVRRGDDLAAKLMEKQISEDERDSLVTACREILPLHDRLLALQGVAARKSEADRLRGELKAAIRKWVSTPLPGARGLTAAETAREALTSLIRFTDLYPNFQPELDRLAAVSPKPEASKALAAEVDRLVSWGVFLRQSSGLVAPLHAEDQRSAAECDYLAGINLTLLSHVLFPAALNRDPNPAWVDPRLTTPKPWRDVYRYDDDTGAWLGWIRHHEGRTRWFNPKGELLPEGPGEGKPAVPVTYLPDPALGLRMIPK